MPSAFNVRCVLFDIVCLYKISYSVRKERFHCLSIENLNFVKFFRKNNMRFFQLVGN